MILKAVFTRYIAPILLSMVFLVLGLIIFACSLVSIRLIDKKVRKAIYYYMLVLGCFMVLTSTWWIVRNSFRAQRVFMTLARESEVRSAALILLQQIAVVGEKRRLFSLKSLSKEAAIIMNED